LREKAACRKGVEAVPHRASMHGLTRSEMSANAP
jgi:hypothetical protein